MTVTAQLHTATLRLVPRSADLSLRAGAPGARLGARFSGREPAVREDGDAVVVEYPRFRALRPSLRGAGGELALDPSVAWDVEIEGGVSKLAADLRGLTLRSLAVAGGACNVEIALPEPAGEVPVRIAGGASTVVLSRPAGAAAELRIAGGAARLAFDGMRFGTLGGSVRLATEGARDAADRYAVEVLGGASRLTVAERDDGGS